MYLYHEWEEKETGHLFLLHLVLPSLVYVFWLWLVL